MEFWLKVIIKRDHKGEQFIDVIDLVAPVLTTGCLFIILLASIVGK